MRKLLILFLLVLPLAASVWAFNPSCFTSQSVESKDLGNNGDTISVFQLGHVTFLTDNTGSPEYKNGWIRNSTEWCLYRSYNDGTLLVQADSGYWVRDITFTYSDKNSGGILADHPWDGQAVNADYSSGKAIVVNAKQKQFYVGKKSVGDGGYLSFTQFKVTCCQFPDSIYLSDQTIYVGETFQLSPQVFPAGRDAIYYWRSSQSGVVTVDNQGVITALAPGMATITASFDSIRATCEVTVLAADNDTKIVETFSNCTVESKRTGTTAVTGDNAIYDWSLHYYQRQLSGSDDKVGDQQGIRLIYDGYIATDGVQEGGVKAMAFDYRTANDKNIVNYQVQVGDSLYEHTSDAQLATTIFHFERVMEVKANTSLAVQMASEIAAASQAYLIFGPITITPYLLFNVPDHQDMMSVNSELNSYDLNKVLINNTGDVPVFEVTDNTTGAVTTIQDGILQMNDPVQSGEIIVRASWDGYPVSTTLTLRVDKIPNPLGGENHLETFSRCAETKLYNGRVHVVGDEGLYDWSLTRFQRQEDDLIHGVQSTRLRYDGSIESNGVQQGGVKELMFDWRVTGVNMPVHFLVSVGDSTIEYTSSSVPTTAVNRFICPFLKAANTTISIVVPAEEKPAQSYLVVSPLTITPYLLFRAVDHQDTVDVRLQTNYDLREALIDNTEGKGTISYAITSDATGAAALVGSVVDLSAVTRNGFVDVQARWGDVSTTMALWVVAEDPAGLVRFTDSPTPRFTKIIKDGQLRIIRDGKLFNAQGVER